jgi:hypothetical protein
MGVGEFQCGKNWRFFKESKYEYSVHFPTKHTVEKCNYLRRRTTCFTFERSILFGAQASARDILAGSGVVVPARKMTLWRGA